MISYLFIESVGVPPLNCYSVIIPPQKKTKKNPTQQVGPSPQNLSPLHLPGGKGTMTAFLKDKFSTKENFGEML